ncbi:MAG: sensor histidine kinase, partial [Bacteroidales bacterium]|nr:sensor histidine kinase [Bacteroidales bacterium]
MAPMSGMMKLGTKFTLFNLLSKLILAAVLILLLPYIIERINVLQTDNELIRKREKVISLISEIGIEPFITPETENEFGSYNILKEEFISLEKAELSEDLNFIDVTQRMIEDETIDYRVLTYSFGVDGITYILEIGKSLSSINNTYKNVRKVILVFFFIFIVITLLSDLIYTRRILRPLKSIIKKLKVTSTPALFDRTPVRTSTYDFIQLDKTVSDLMSKIEELFEKEKEVTVNISHELMTPVSVLRSKLENMLLKKDLDSEVEAGIEESLRTLHRLKTLVNSLLLIAR